MPKKAIETADLRVPQKSLIFNVTVWVDQETMHELDLIAAYERLERSPLCRMILQEKIRVYRRNPAYKRFLKQLQRTQEAEK